MSDKTPPILTMGADEKNPLKNRVIMMVCTSLATAVPKAKMAPRKKGGKTAMRRPYNSLTGAQSSGPMPKLHRKCQPLERQESTNG